MCGEGQASRLYKYNGLSPRMFHTARHFRHLKPACRSAGSNLPQMYMWLNATHAPDCQEASNDIRVRADDREDEAPAGSGGVHEWEEQDSPAAGVAVRCGSNKTGWSERRLRPGGKPWPHTGGIIHKSPPDFTPTPQSAPAFHLPSPGARWRAIIAAVPENNLTRLCVSMATRPTSIAVSPLPVYICNYQQRLQRRDGRNERRRRFSSTRWFKMWSCGSTGYFYWHYNSPCTLSRSHS